MIRVSLEVLGIGAFIGLHYAIIFVYFLGSGLRGVATDVYWSVIALGYIGMIVLAVFRRLAFRMVSWRGLLDSWLLAFPVAIGLSLMFMILKWPLKYAGWDAHGMGASGGEANSMFLPWLHLVIWALIAKRWISDRIETGARRPVKPSPLDGR